jgi:transposase
MRHVELSTAEIRALKQRLRQTKELREFRRLQALLMVAEGLEIKKVSDFLGVTVQSIYHWLDRYDRYRQAHRMREGHHPGRPPVKSSRVEALLEKILVQKPQDYGYRFALWTVKLMVDHLKHRYDLEVSPSTVRRCLRQLRYHYKRPRYVLSRLSPTWRQQKGGFKEA